MLPLLRFLRRLVVPALTGVLLTGLMFLLSVVYAVLTPLREPFDLLCAGLTGVWAARSRKVRAWPIEALAGSLAGVVVGASRALLGYYLAGLPASTELLLLGRMVLAGAVGAVVSRLLRQRVVL